MKKIGNLIWIVIAFMTVSCTSNREMKTQHLPITFVEDIGNKKINVLADGKLFTTFQWPDNVCKPVLYPIFATSGTEITRGFPMDPKAGERADHPHQIGMWLTYGNVNGLDFWGNGSQGLGTKNANGGFIKHTKTESISEKTGSFVTFESWVDSTGTELLNEKTEFRFAAIGTTRIIDRKTTLTAGETEISMPDTKEGMFGIRVARQLELPISGTVELYNEDGTTTRFKDTLNVGITGNYRSSEGITGEAVWGTRAKWMDLFGNIGDEKISLVICDHPENPNYPTYWHARGYGLFAANPLGVKDFTKGENALDFKIPAGTSVTFSYRVIIASGEHLSDEEINTFASDFAEK